MSEPVININLNLTLAEVNVILTSLGKQPYESVASTLHKVRAQAIPQLQAAQAEAEANKAAEEAAASSSEEAAEAVSSDNTAESA